MKKPYSPPELESVTINGERGYAASSLQDIVDQFANPLNDQIELMFLGSSQSDGSHIYRETEDFSSHNDWNQGSDGFWQ